MDMNYHEHPLSYCNNVEVPEGIPTEFQHTPRTFLSIELCILLVTLSVAFLTNSEYSRSARPVPSPLALKVMVEKQNSRYVGRVGASYTCSTSSRSLRFSSLRELQVAKHQALPFRVAECDLHGLSHQILQIDR